MIVARTTALYVIVDDVLKALRWHEDARRQLSDAEVITAALVAALLFGGNQERACAVLRELRLMPQMLGKSRFSRRLHAVGDLVERAFLHLGLVLKATSDSPRYRLDSFPVELCDNIRIKRCRLVAGNEAFRGKHASKRRFFYGVRVVVLATEAGAPVEFAFLPGSAFDVRGLNVLPLMLPSGSEVYADAAYSSAELEALALEQDGVDLQVCLRRNNARRQSPQREAAKKIIRQPVESLLSGITALFGRRVHAVTFRSFQLKIVLFLLAYSLKKTGV
jgi:hypothetical protein